MTTKDEQVHCLACDDVYIEPHGILIEACPACGNDDLEQTVYLEPDSESRIKRNIPREMCIDLLNRINNE